MPAGYGKRCELCYWRDRSDRNARQLVELIERATVKKAFLAYAAWLVEDENGIQRRARRLREHVEFFVSLDRLEEEPWDSEFLLKHFGTALLRRYELPVKWLEQQFGTEIPAGQKLLQAELNRVKEAVEKIPPNTLARTVIEAFAKMLIKRCDAGSMSVRSARLALRPAVCLLEFEDVTSGRLPGQSALNRYLESVPGQRAAASTFIGFLKAAYGVTLNLPPKQTPTSPAVRLALRKQIEAMILAPEPTEDFDRRWVILALRYFHHMSSADAKAISRTAAYVENGEGFELSFDGRSYWVPKQPKLLPQSDSALPRR